LTRICKEGVSRSGAAETGYGYELLVDWSEKLETRKDLLLGSVGLNDGADDGDINVLGAHVMSVRDHRDVDIYEKMSHARGASSGRCAPFRLLTWF
jgi:hypothetical protein